MKDFLNHAKTYIFRGVLASIPLALSLLVVQFIYVIVDKRVGDFFDYHFGFRVPGMGILAVLILLYLIGLMASNVLGRRVLHIMEKIFDRIPLIKAIYQVGKQVSFALSLPEKQVFKQVVLVDVGGIRAPGFVTGNIVNKTKGDEKLLKVFIPTGPNPTTGFVVVVKESQTMDPQWSVEEAMRAVISCGIIGPEVIGEKAVPKTDSSNS